MTVAALDFLDQLYANCEGGWLTLFTLERANGAQQVHWYALDDRWTLAADVTKMTDRCVWFGVATRKMRQLHGRGAAGDCLQVPALWLDVDVATGVHAKSPAGRAPLPADHDAAHALLADHPIAPTIVVDTGGGLQAWWVLDEPLPAAEAQPVLDQWRDTWATIAARRGWHLDNVHDVARVMRLPGTFNTKEAK